MQKILLLDRSYTERGRRRMGFLLVKRTFDVLASFCMLLVLLPLGLLVALICALDTKSSPIFSQERMGRGDKPFRIYKFRTMSPRTPADVATHQLVGAENYISRTGRVLRKLSLDELPQIYNILAGQMSRGADRNRSASPAQPQRRFLCPSGPDRAGPGERP